MRRGIVSASVIAAGLAIGSIGPVLAADLAASGPTSPWDLAFGVTITSDYIGRGITQTDHGLAIQPWAEFQYGIFYAGYWGSNVVDDWENDLSIGIRPEVGPVSLDLGYVRYIYSNNVFATPSGEAYVKGSVAPVDPLTLGAAFYINPDNSATYTEANASYEFMEHFKASAAIGFVGNSGADYTTWNAGIAWSPVEPVTFDIRYHSGPASDKVVASLSLASSLKGIGVLH